jgi:hypothetical protein
MPTSLRTGAAAQGLEQFEQFVGVNQATGVFYRGPRPYSVTRCGSKTELWTAGARQKLPHDQRMR